jgi:DinB family protein
MSIPQVQPVLKTIERSRSRFLYGLDRVPEDRLEWSPGGAAKNPLQLAGKTAAFVQFVAQLLQTRAMPDRSGGLPPAPTSREEARAAVDAGFRRLTGVISGLSESDLELPVPMPWKESPPLGEVLYFLPTILGYFQGQLNYLQLAYGDEDPNIPPDWRPQS